MTAMNEMSLVIEELRTAAKALISAADSLMQMYSAPEENEAGLLQERKPMTLEEVRDILRRRCEEGYAADVKQLIADFGARSLKDVNPDDYEPLVKAVQALGTGGDDDA
jgi:ElaB/YqjD/DUF883 family membrane-anchored ribosome-binding protein